MKNQFDVEFNMIENENSLSFSIKSNNKVIEYIPKIKPNKIRSLGDLITKEEIIERMEAHDFTNRSEEREFSWGWQRSLQSDIDKEIDSIRKSLRKIVKYKLTKRLVEEVELEKFEPSFQKQKDI